MSNNADIKWYVWLILCFVTIAIIAAGIFYILLLPIDKRIESIAGISGSIGTLLTVLWFSASLMYQGKQIKEQRKQFMLNNDQTKFDLKLNALEKANNILNDSLEKIEKNSNGKYNYRTIFDAYLTNIHLFDALSKDNPDEVINMVKDWIEYEAYLNMYLDAIISSYKVYAEVVGIELLKRDKKEDFILANKDVIFNTPYYSHHNSYAFLVAHIMANMAAKRAAMLLAIQVAVEIKNPNSKNQSNLHKEIQISKSKNEAFAKIVEVYEDKHPTTAST